MYIDWIFKSRNPRNSNLVRKNRENNYFPSRTKLEVIRYIGPRQINQVSSIVRDKFPPFIQCQFSSQLQID